MYQKPNDDSMATTTTTRRRRRNGTPNVSRFLLTAICGMLLLFGVHAAPQHTETALLDNANVDAATDTTTTTTTIIMPIDDALSSTTIAAATTTTTAAATEQPSASSSTSTSTTLTTTTESTITASDINGASSSTPSVASAVVLPNKNNNMNTNATESTTMPPPPAPALLDSSSTASGDGSMTSTTSTSTTITTTSPSPSTSSELLTASNKLDADDDGASSSSTLPPSTSSFSALPITTIEPISSTEPTTTPLILLEEDHSVSKTANDDSNVKQNETDDEAIINSTTTENEIKTEVDEAARKIVHPSLIDNIQHIYGALDEEKSTENVISSTANDIYAEGEVKVNLAREQGEKELTILASTTMEPSLMMNSHENSTELLINHIAGPAGNDDDDKDLNNFRHPATLITASQSDDTTVKGNDSAMGASRVVDGKSHDDKMEMRMIDEDEHDEDPYHAHILSENHDRLAEHADYKMMSSVEESTEISGTTSSTSTTPSTDGIVVSVENKATLAPMEKPKAEDDETYVARAMDVETTTTTTDGTPVISIVEGQHAFHNQHDREHVDEHTHEHIHDHTNDHTHDHTNDHTHDHTHDHIHDHTNDHTLDHIHDHTHVPTIETSTSEATPSEMPYVFAGEGRSVGSSSISAEDDHLNYHFNFVTTDRPTDAAAHEHKNAALMDLSDVSMDMEEEEVGKNSEAKVKISEVTATSMNGPTVAEIHRDCVADGKSFKSGETMEHGCDERCTCNRGEWICAPRCMGASFKRGSAHHTTITNPNCREMPVENDECCARMECSDGPLLTEGLVASADNASTQKSRRDCLYNGGTYKFRERLEIGCEQICHCDEEGYMNCKPRCPQRNHTRLDKCVYVKDPKDVCCQLELCDVTLDDHEQTPSPPSAQNSIGDEPYGHDDEELLQQGRENNADVEGAGLAADCEFKGKTYGDGQQFHDGCEQLCICTKEGVHCAKLQCPSTFGLDVLNPHCLKWVPEPENFEPIVPNCCPDSMRCVDNGTCEYQGHMFDNWSPIPTNLTGCEQHCYCEHGRVECRPACPPVLALPPADLPCHPAQARLLPIPDDDCCKHWACAPVVPKIAGPTLVPSDEGSNAHNESFPVHNNNELATGKPLKTDTAEKKPTNAFYPTLDGKPPKGQPSFVDYGKHEKHEKTAKKPTVPVKSQQNDVKYDVHEPQEEPEHPGAGLGFIPIHLGGGGVGGGGAQVGQPISPYDSVHYNQNLGPQHPQPGGHAIPFGYYHPGSNPKDHYDPYNPYEQYDINPNGIPQGKPPAPTSQSDLFNILGAGRPGLVGPVPQMKVNPGGHPHGLPPPPHVRIEQILQHLHQNAQQQQQQQQQQHNPHHQQQGPPGPYGHANGSGVGVAIHPHNIHHPQQQQHHQHHHQQQQQQQQHIAHHPQYVPIVHSGLPPPPPLHDIAIVDGHPVAYGGYPVIPGLGQPPLVHINMGPHEQQHQSSSKAPVVDTSSVDSSPSSSSSSLPTPSSSSPSTSSTTPAKGLTAQSSEHGVQPARPSETGFNNLQPDIDVITLEAIDPRTVRIVFTVPQVYVNLHGRVELRYTNGPGNDTTTWEQQIFAPPEDLIATSQMEFDLPGLEPNSLYKVKITLILRDLNSQPTSSIYTVKTPADRTITPPPPITDYRPDFQDIFKKIEDPELNVSETNSTWLQLTWKKLTDDQLEYVDGLQLRYKELTGMIYSSTPLVHRTLTSYTIENLQPDTGYEIGLYYIPLPGHGAELRAGHMIKVRTAPKVDVFAFDVMVNVTKVKAQSVEVSWNGVPYPEDKFVNIYRAIYQSDAGKEDSSVFKVAKRDSTTGTLIMDLKPGTKYRLWLEMYLTNGNIKKSNVVNFITKPGGPAAPGKTGKLLTAGVTDQPAGDYYGPLVVVSVVAALAIMSTIVLLLILTRRRVHQTASITPPRKSDAAYDNPSYKVEIQQETMNL